MQTLYHMQSKNIRHRRTLLWVFALVCVVVIALAALSIYKSFHENSLEQGALSVKEAVLDSAIQCASVEGSYPSELSYLEDNYGLSINHNEYIVVYVCFASNSVPSVSVVPR